MSLSATAKVEPLGAAERDDRVEVVLQIVDAVFEQHAADTEHERLAGFDVELVVIAVLDPVDRAANGRRQPNGLRFLRRVVVALGLGDDRIRRDDDLPDGAGSVGRGDAEVADARQRVGVGTKANGQRVPCRSALATCRGLLARGDLLSDRNLPCSACFLRRLNSGGRLWFRRRRIWSLTATWKQQPISPRPLLASTLGPARPDPSRRHR